MSLLGEYKQRADNQYILRILLLANYCVCLWFLGLIPANAQGPRIGLVLSGGGARGVAHIGVLKVLEAMRIPIHAIAATSMGALVGGVYASGMPIAEMEHQVCAADWNDLFTDDPPRSSWPMRRKREAERPTLDFAIGRHNGEFTLPRGAVSGQKIQLFIADLVKNSDGVVNYDELPIPFRAVATNLENGQPKVFKSGPLAEALRASMSVPGIFAPLEQADGIYVDGGLVRNLPVDIVRSMGVDVVIAVNLGSSYLTRDKLNNVFGVTGQMITILTEQNVHTSLAELNPNRDILILPALGDIDSTNFDRVAETIPIGEQAVHQVEKQLLRYQLSEQDYAAWQAARLRTNPRHPLQVADVQLEGLNNVNPALFEQLRQHQKHKPLDRNTLKQDIQAVYSSGDFERIGYRMERTGDRGLLIVDAIEKSWGPGYLSFGLGLMNDHHGDGRFGLRTSYRQTWLNSLGAEWLTDIIIGNAPRLHTELYQPFDVNRQLFAVPYLDLGITPLHIYAADNRVARYDVSHGTLGAEIGANLGTDVELRLGPYWTTQHFAIDTGSLVLPESEVQDSGVRARLFLDNMDSGYVPRDGQRVTFDYKHPFQVIGNQGEYNRLYATWQGAYTLDNDSLIGMLRGGSSFGSHLPYYEQFPLGGFLNLTGYANEQFRGSEMLYGSLSYQHRIAVLPSPLGRGLYLGSSLEMGQLWRGDALQNQFFGTISSAPQDTLYSASLFFGADTWVGPIYLGFGLSGSGSTGIYVLIGQQ